MRYVCRNMASFGHNGIDQESVSLLEMSVLLVCLARSF